MGSTGVWRWCINITITILDIIHRPVFYFKHTISSSETSVPTRATRRNIPEDTILHSHRCENLKSYMEKIHFIGFRTHDLPTCSIVPEPLHYRVPQIPNTTFSNYVLSSENHTSCSKYTAKLTNKRNPVAFSPQGNYTHWATAAAAEVVPNVWRGQRNGSLRPLISVL
jgi:hypothetical protein